MTPAPDHTSVYVKLALVPVIWGSTCAGTAAAGGRGAHLMPPCC